MDVAPRPPFRLVQRILEPPGIPRLAHALDYVSCPCRPTNPQRRPIPGSGGPPGRLLGGRDDLAGGTWLAANEHGVVAGLTNRPASRDPARRSRGELPLTLAADVSAEIAVDALVRDFRPLDYNPAWILVGDRSG